MSDRAKSGAPVGSNGPGRLTDYPGKTRQKSDRGDGGSRDGNPQEDRCTRAISTELEDVEHCAYFKKHKASPPTGTHLRVAHEKRLVAQTDVGETVGNLPTRFNYLAACMQGGYTYVGEVRNSSDGPPAATVAADFAAIAP